jgi:hypothetical protein
MARFVRSAALLVGFLLVLGCGEAPKKDPGISQEEMKKRMDESKAQMEKMREKMQGEKPKGDGDKKDK